MAAQYSVAEAAEALGVHPQRIHQRIREGSLHATKIGGRWVLDARDVHALRSHRSPGRPLSERTAWNLLRVAVGADAHLSPVDRSRARSYLRNLLAHAADGDNADQNSPWVAALDRALRNRAERRLYAASPRDLPDLRDDDRVHLSGVSLPGSNMSAADVVEGYVHRRDLDEVVDYHLLSPGDRDRANVILHVIPEGPDLHFPDLGPILCSPLALAADLAEHQGPRERGEALREIHAYLADHKEASS